MEAEARSAEPRAIVLRRCDEQTQEAAAHGFFRAEAAPLRDPLDRLARVRQQARSIRLLSLRHARHAQAFVYSLAAREIDGIVAERRGSKPRDREARIEFEPRTRGFA